MADLRGVQGTRRLPLSAKMSSFSCTVFRKNWSNSRLVPPPPPWGYYPPLRNAGFISSFLQKPMKLKKPWSVQALSVNPLLIVTGLSTLWIQASCRGRGIRHGRGPLVLYRNWSKKCITALDPLQPLFGVSLLYLFQGAFYST